MARIGSADREHSGHYTSAVAVVAVVVAGLAWFGQNRTLAAAAAALGLYALHLFSIRFLLDNQKRQQRVLDAQWEVLQRFIDSSEQPGTETGDLVPAMPVDRESPERPAAEKRPRAEPEAPVAQAEAEAGDLAQPSAAPALTPPEVSQVPADVVRDAVVRDAVVPPAEALGGSSAVGMRPAERPMEVVAQVAQTKPPARGPVSEVPVPRHFALGTVALVRDLLSPAEVARVLLEQRRQSGKKFGVLAVEMGLLSESQREELLLAQQEGLFTDAEMREARQRLREFRENAAHSMAGLD